MYGRHNKTRDLNCDLLEKAGLKQVKCEPVITETDENGENGLRADWGVRGFWESQKMALFDVCILNPDAPSFKAKTLESIFETRKKIKKNTYSEAAKLKRATFTPFIAKYLRCCFGC